MTIHELRTRIISWTLLSFIVMYIAIPAIPVIDYLLNRDYIAKNLCVNKDKPKSCCKGKCHLVKQLNKTNPDKGKDKKELPNRIQLKQLQDFIISNSDESLFCNAERFLFCILQSPVTDQFLNRVYIPPEV